MENFSKRYAKLNKAQKQAVDTIDGPVMVIAGPGTGKTELLSVRAANILKRTDTLPENILCLTFTENGANTMRERLTEIIGKEAYKVAIHTFHSFGVEVINQNRQYFYHGAHFSTADELSRYEIINDIFKQLEYNNPLSSKLGDEYTYLSDSITAISELKKNGLASGELLAILDANDAVIDKVEQLLSPIFAEGIKKNTAEKAIKHQGSIRKSSGELSIKTIVPLSEILANSLESSAKQAIDSNSTKPITAWRNLWFKKDNNGNFILKSRERQIKLRALCFVYDKYLSDMEKGALYDFDDMILQVVHTMEIVDDLRFNLQEKYQYIMVDEFQDTNMAQMRILHNLTNNIAHGDTPNIMVVGDDDQAIYSFQGADISNIIDFQTNYPKAGLITLTENYRSNDDILSGSRDIILQGHDRLENLIKGIDKNLSAQNKQHKGGVILREAETIAEERHFIVSDIKSRIKSGEKPSDIAVFTRRHNEINALLPYFSHANIAVNYERRDNVLELAPIIFIEQLAQLLIDISKGRHDAVNATLPEILTHKAWGIAPAKLWSLSLRAYKNHLHWFETMTDTPEFKDIQNWLIKTALLIDDTPLEKMLDIIVGRPDTNLIAKPEFVSPLYDYYFSNDKLDKDPNEYLIYLNALRTIRAKLRNYKPNQTPTLHTFIEFMALNRKLGSTISAVRPSIKSHDAINVMTAHKSKGLEFKTVYVIDAVDTIWGGRARNRSRLITYPENLPLAPAGESDDERLRLFYVAITRAKQNLNISYSLYDNNDKDTQRAVFLMNDKWDFKQIPPLRNPVQISESVELAWYQTLADPIGNNMKELLSPILDNYKLSITHLHNFLNVTRGGPTMFLLQNLLKFPQTKSPNAAFGIAIHEALQEAHTHLSATGNRQAPEDVVSNFEKILKSHYLTPKDFQDFLQKGSDALRIFLDQNYDSFSVDQQTELNFSNQHSMVDKARLAGKLDLVNINKPDKTIVVTDYKTGKSTHSWTGKNELEKIKLHRYKQQLLFYKLLIEKARDYRGYRVSEGIVQFVEPNMSKKIQSITENFDDKEIELFSKLINTVWTHIMGFNLPDVTGYDKTYKGMLAFEQDLIDGII
jgi:DNA helicase-2/ATP-dependent DNA helicase PcrA